MSNNFLRFSFATILLLTNLIVLGFAVSFGMYHFAGALGWGDSLDLFRAPQSIGEFLSYWHEKVNGRLGQALLTSLFLPIRWSSLTPESFPWWLVSSLALFCTLMTPIHFLLSIPGRIATEWRLLWLAPLVWLIWSFNPVTFYNRELFILMELIAYSLPIYLVSIAIMLLARGRSTFFSSSKSFTIVALGGACFALLGEQYLLAIPVLVFGVTLMRLARKEFSSSVAIKLVGWTAIGVLAGFVIYWLSPGQAIRHELLKSLSPFSLWKFYEHPVINSYKMLFHLPEELHQKARIGLLIAHSVLLLGVFWWAKTDFSKNAAEERTSLHGVGIFVATLLVAFHACFLTLLVAAYLPGYAYVFPSLLLATALSLGGFVAWQKMCGVLVVSKIKWAILPVGAVTILSVILHVGTHNWRSNSETARMVEQNNQHRKKAYAEVLLEVKNHGTKNFVLLDCPLAYPAFGWTMEPPWGLSGYFAWWGHPSIHVYLQGNSDFPPDWEKQGYKTIKCL